MSPGKHSPVISLYHPLYTLTFLKNLKTPKQRRSCFLSQLEVVPYCTAWEYQSSLVTERINNPDLADVLILLEHPPVYTLGTGANLDFLKFNPTQTNWEVHRVERGGEVTYHCPGQLVGYPILNLRYYQTDLHWYLRQLEEVIIDLLQVYGLEGYRIPKLTGVWCQGRKVAAIGIKVRRWITMHGFSLNVCPNLTGFQHIIPCGIADKPIGTLAEFIPEITVEQVRQDLKNIFAEVFQWEFIELAGFKDSVIGIDDSG